MKKILLIMMILCLSACAAPEMNEVNTPKPSESEKPNGACEIGKECDSEKVINTKDGLKWNILSLKEANDNLDGTKVLFFSFETCPFCMIARPILEEVMEEYNDIDIYYVDVKREERDETNEEYKKMYEYLKPKLQEEYNAKIYMPTIAFIKDGELVDTYTGNFDLDGDDKTYNEEEIIKQAEIYRDYLNKLK